MSKSLVWQDWINEALDEYEFAKESFENSYNDKRYKFYCFHFQQSAEKALKAVVIKTGSVKDFDSLKTHKIEELLLMISELKDREDYEELLEDAAYLSAFAVIRRYPDSPYEPSKCEVVDAMNCNKKIYNIAVDILLSYVPLYLQIFPDYDDIINIITGWNDTSNVNDYMPSMSYNLPNSSLLKLTIDYKNPSFRHGNKRYTLYLDDKIKKSSNSMDVIMHEVNMIKKNIM